MSSELRVIARFALLLSALVAAGLWGCQASAAAYRDVSGRPYSVAAVLRSFAGIRLYKTADSPPIYTSGLMQPGSYGVVVTVYPTVALARTVYKRDLARLEYSGWRVRLIRNVEVDVGSSRIRMGVRRKQMRAMPAIVSRGISRLAALR